MVIYADAAFIINFAFDAELLVILCKLFSKKIPKIKVIISASLGGLLGVFAFIPYFEILTRPPSRFIFPLFMVYMVLKPSNKKDFLVKYISFISISFIMSGAINFLNLNVFTGLLIPWLIYLCICILRKNIIKKKREVILEYENKTINTEGFYDSGNMLLSGGLPVILASSRIFEKLLGCKISEENILSLSEKYKMRIIPFVSLGKGGTVMGIKLDRIWVDGREYNNVVLAFAGNRFSDDLILNSVMT